MSRVHIHGGGRAAPQVPRAKPSAFPGILIDGLTWAVPVGDISVLHAA